MKQNYQFSMAKIIFLAAILISCLPNVIMSQSLNTQTFRGIVYERATQEKLIDANITLSSKNIKLKATTNSQGEFTISNVPIGRYRILVNMVGFKPYQANNILVLSGRETVLEIPIEQHIVQLDEVLVTTQVKDLPINKSAVVSARMLSSEESNRYAGSWGDPARMVVNFAGVTATQDMRNDIIVRGNSPVGTQWRLDGFEIPNPNHFGALGGTGGPIGMLNNNQLANSDFYTGAFPAEFGNATSGVFDLRLRNGNNQKHEFIGAMGFNGLEFGAEGPIYKTSGSSYMVNARYSFLKIMETLGMGFGTGGTPEYQDVTSKINIPLKNGNLAWITMLGASKVHFYSEIEKDPDYKPNVQVENYDMDINNNQIFTGINYMYRFSNAARLENRVSYQRFSRNIDNRRIGFPQKNMSIFFTGKEIEAQYDINTNFFSKINTHNELKAGGGVTVYDTDLYNVLKMDTVLQNFNDYSTLFKTFGQWQHRFNDALSLTTGVYGQYYMLNNDYSIEPRFGVEWIASSKTSFSLGGGMYSQLQPRSIYFYQKDGLERNRNLQMSRNLQCVLGYNQRINENIHLKTELYYQYLYNIPVMSDKPAESILNMGDDYYNDWDAIFVNQGIGKNYGIELTVEKYFDENYYFLITCALYDSKYQGYDGIERHTKFAGHFSLNGLLGYEWKLGETILLSVNTKCSYIGGKRYVPLTKQSHDEYKPDYTQAYTNQLANYFRLDVNIAMKQNFNTWSLEWFCEIDNITNHKNIGMKYYDEVFQKEKYMYQSGFMPMGGCRIYF